MDRTITLQVVGGALTLALLAASGCGRTDAGGDDMAIPAANAGEDHAPPDAATEAQLASLRGATARFHNFDEARAAGYDAQITPCWYHRERGGQGYHYGRQSSIDGEVALLEPELLMYAPDADGRMRFLGVEYIVPFSEWHGAEPPAMLGRHLHRNETLGLYVLHVWLAEENPAGVFADWNPAVSCEYARESEDRA